MAEWHGFPTLERAQQLPGRGRLRVAPDYFGPDDDPLPVAVLLQSNPGNERHPLDMVELTADDLRWLVDEVAPAVLKRMGERP